LLDDDRRAEVAHQVRAVDLEGGFYAQDESDAFLNAFRSIYRDSTVDLRGEFAAVAEGFDKQSGLERAA
jgi:hypothetical protein